MKTSNERRNELDVVVDSNHVPHLEVLVEHGEGEIWASFHMITRLLESVTLYTDDDEVDIKSEVMADWIPHPKFRTVADIQEVIEAIEMWRPSEPDYAETLSL